MQNNFILNVFKKASLCRNFELKVFEQVKKKNIKIPVYLSAGQEFISSTLSTICEQKKIKPLLFPQHRCHSIYLSFGGDIKSLIDELLGRKSGCTNGMGGSASIHSKKIKMYGHDGLMGSQVPIAIGACYASKKPTIVFLGDASAEEDYVLAALGWASFKKLPILFVVEDNNMSIKTEKKIRRHWEMSDVGKGFKIESYTIKDDPNALKKVSKNFFKKTVLLNINTNRLFWHSGAGIDSENIFDNYKKYLSKNSDFFNIDKTYKEKVDKLWQKQLEK